MRNVLGIVTTVACCGMLGMHGGGHHQSHPSHQPSMHSARRSLVDGAMHGEPSAWQDKIGDPESGGHTDPGHHTDREVAQSALRGVTMVVGAMLRRAAQVLGAFGIGPLAGCISHANGVSPVGSVLVGAGIDSVTALCATFRVYHGILGRAVLHDLANFMTMRIAKNSLVLIANADELLSCASGDLKALRDLKARCDAMPAENVLDQPSWCLAECRQVWELMSELDQSAIQEGCSVEQSHRFVRCAELYLEHAKEKYSAEDRVDTAEFEIRVQREIYKELLQASKQLLSCKAKAIGTVCAMTLGGTVGALLTLSGLPVESGVDERGQPIAESNGTRTAAQGIARMLGLCVAAGANIAGAEHAGLFLREVRSASLRAAAHQAIQKLDQHGLSGQMRVSFEPYAQDVALRQQLVDRAVASAERTLDDQQREAQTRRAVRVKKAAKATAAAGATATAAGLEAGKRGAGVAGQLGKAGMAGAKELADRAAQKMEEQRRARGSVADVRIKSTTHYEAEMTERATEMDRGLTGQF